MNDQEYQEVIEKSLGRGSRFRMPLLIAVTAISVALALFAAISLLGGFSESDESLQRENNTLERASLAACERNNLLRREINHQAEAFVHHNEATLTWALQVRPVLRAATTPDGRRAWKATGTLIGAYRGVRGKYFELPIVDCAKRATRDPVEPREPIWPRNR